MGNSTIYSHQHEFPLSNKPNHVNCPYCHRCGITRTTSWPSERAHLYALLICILGCFPFCIVPYFMNSCKSVRHYCPYCGGLIGTYHR